MNKFFLPQLKKLSIYDYSLYKCPLEINFSSKLNIIYGTNGTGKSTLLMLILFSIVGPYRGGIKTKIRKEQRKDNRPLYEESFFKDRTIEHSEYSKVTSIFTINKDEYTVTHSLVDGRLLGVSINNVELTGKAVTYRTYELKYFRSQDKKDDDTTEYLIDKYQKSLKQSTNLPGGVNTLINMLLDVMFFDERRELTFWNSNLQEIIIGKYIVDANFYEKYCEQKLNTKALQSAYKKKSETLNYMSKFFEREKETGNFAWDKNKEQEIDLRIELNNIENEIIKLEQSRSEDQNLYERKNNELLIYSRKEETIREELLTLDEKWYKNLFPNQYNMYYNKFSKHMLDGICPICGNKHSFDIKTEYCIMCKEKITLTEKVDLIKIDIDRKNKKNEFLQVKKISLQIKRELDDIKKRIDLYRKQISEKYLRKNQIEIHLTPTTNPLEDSDTKRLDKAKIDRDEALKIFNLAKEKEEKMKKVIEDSLVDNFNLFQKSFLKYASSFFGNTHKIKLSLPFKEENSLDKLMIKFRLDEKDRDESYMLSESQRIFTDLSFRFSILTTFHDNSFFICETPDSTLDMFHEENAVKTFEAFIEKGNSLILTANARESNLISKLYHKYGFNNLNIVDLTQLSQLALNKQFSFKSYIGGSNNNESE